MSSAVSPFLVERLRLLGRQPDYSAGTLALVTDIAHLFASGDIVQFNDDDTALLVQLLFRFGCLSLAARIVSVRRARGTPASAFDRLAESYEAMAQYDFEPIEVPSHAPIFVDLPERAVRLRVLSFYFNTPTFQQNGYSVRTQSILLNTSLEIIPFAKIGYPWTANLARDSEQRLVTKFGNISYHHRRGRLNNQNDVFRNFSLAKQEIVKLIAELKPDAIHAASNFTVGLPALYAAREARLPFIYEMRGIWEATAGVGVHGWEESERYRVERQTETFIARSADQVITLTDTQRAEVVARGISPDRVSVVPNFFEAETEEAVKGVAAPGPGQELFPGKIVIGYIGALAHYEGLQDLIEVLARRRPELVDVRLVVVGDGPHSATLKAITAERGVEDLVLFTGRIPRAETVHIYNRTDLCVLPRLDVLVAQLVSPLKLVEILAMGKVLLVSNVEAMAELVRRLGYGEQFQCGDLVDLERKLIEVIGNIDALKSRYATAREHIRESYTWKQGARLWDECMREAVGRWRTLEDDELHESTAADALHTLRPAALDVTRRTCELMVRVTSVKLVSPDVQEILITAPKPMLSAVRVVAVDLATFLGQWTEVQIDASRSSAKLAVPQFPSQAEWAFYIYLPKRLAERANVAAWKIVGAKLAGERRPMLAVELEHRSQGEEVLEIQSAYDESVRFVMAAIPLGQSRTTPLFANRPISTALGAKFSYVSIEAGEATVSLRTGVSGSAMVELYPWPGPDPTGPVRIAQIVHQRSSPRGRSYFLDLPADRHNVLVLARLNENLVDGSAIWLKTLAGSLAANRDVNVYVMTHSALLTNSIMAPLFSRPNVAKIDLGSDGDPTPEALAREAFLLDRVSGGFDSIVVRGTDVARFLDSRATRARTLFYSVGLIRPDNVEDGRCIDTDALELMCGHAGLIFQNELTRQIFLESCPTYRGDCYVIPPSVDTDDAAAAQSVEIPGPPENYVIYAGKLIREYGLLELTAAVLELRAAGADDDLCVVVLGNKFDGTDPEFRREFLALAARLGDALRWYPAVSPVEVLAWVRRARAVWGWRHGTFEEGHFEVSTKMVEALSMGRPIVLYPSASNRALLGEAYPGFAETAEKAGSVLRRLMKRDDALAAGLERFGKRFHNRHTYSALTASLACRAPGRRILVASHDFKFFQDLEALFLKEGHRVVRQNWLTHSRVLDQGALGIGDGIDIIHCEWCLGNAVYWSQNAPRGARVFIRFHRQELTTEFPRMVDYQRVEKIIFISSWVMRAAIRLFDVPPEKCIVVPISVPFQPEEFSEAELESRRNVIGMVGFVPWLKRPDLVLELFGKLRQLHPQLRLRFKGSMPTSYDWMSERPEELTNYARLFDRMGALVREGAIEFDGFSPHMEAFYRSIGWIVSASDIEGCHTAVAEGGIMGCLPLMGRWDGAAEVYPPEYVSGEVDDMVTVFGAWYETYVARSRAIQAEFISTFGIDRVYATWKTLWIDDDSKCPRAGKVSDGMQLALGAHP